jgi:hypothetical protein
MIISQITFFWRWTELLSQTILPDPTIPHHLFSYLALVEAIIAKNALLVTRRHRRKAKRFSGKPMNLVDMRLYALKIFKDTSSAQS